MALIDAIRLGLGGSTNKLQEGTSLNAPIQGTSKETFEQVAIGALRPDLVDAIIRSEARQKEKDDALRRQGITPPTRNVGPLAVSLNSEEEQIALLRKLDAGADVSSFRKKDFSPEQKQIIISGKEKARAAQEAEERGGIIAGLARGPQTLFNKPEEIPRPTLSGRSQLGV
ncbi:MAG: hypothetical protein KAV87_13015 [Desulfobacteraceae bacterium]|nr:hypothetical protein [Desulfobacteraceae bacterium]